MFLQFIMKRLTLIFIGICIALVCDAQQNATGQRTVTASYDAVNKKVLFIETTAMPVDRIALIDIKVKAIDAYVKENAPKEEVLKVFADERSSLLQLRDRYVVESERVIRDLPPYQVIKEK